MDFLKDYPTCEQVAVSVWLASGKAAVLTALDNQRASILWFAAINAKPLDFISAGLQRHGEPIIDGLAAAS